MVSKTEPQAHQLQRIGLDSAGVTSLSPPRERPLPARMGILRHPPGRSQLWVFLNYKPISQTVTSRLVSKLPGIRGRPVSCVHTLESRSLADRGRRGRRAGVRPLPPAPRSPGLFSFVGLILSAADRPWSDCCQIVLYLSSLLDRALAMGSAGIPDVCKLRHSTSDNRVQNKRFHQA